MYRARVNAILAALITVLLLAPTGVSAQILLDDFLDDTGAVAYPAPPNSAVSFDIEGTEIDRLVSVQAAGTFSIVGEVLGGGFVVDASGPGSGSAEAQFEYLGFLFDLGTLTFFQFSTNHIEGTPVLGLILTDSALGQISGNLQLGPVTSETVFSLDLTQFAGYTPGFGAALNSVNVLISDSDQSFFVEGNSFSFSPVPEPSAVFLVVAALSVLLGLRYRRIV